MAGMSLEDENRLKAGPLNCPWKDYANKAVCTRGCGNYEALMQHTIEYYNYRQQIGKPLSIQQIVDGIESAELPPIHPLKVKRDKCKEQPRIPVVAIEVVQKFKT